MTVTVRLPLLDSVRIASPCPMKWEQLTPTGDHPATRHCEACGLNVHNISQMTRDEAEAFLRDAAAAEGRVCAGFHRRPDGTIITRDCPVGLREVRRRLRRVASRIAAAVGLLATGGYLLGVQRDGRMSRLRRIQPFSRVCEWIAPTPASAPFVVGLLRVPPSPQQTPASTSGGTNDHQQAQDDTGCSSD